MVYSPGLPVFTTGAPRPWLRAKSRTVPTGSSMYARKAAIRSSQYWNERVCEPSP